MTSLAEILRDLDRAEDYLHADDPARAYLRRVRAALEADPDPSPRETTT